MTRIIDYPTVLETAKADGLRSLYHNSGAFGFPPESATTSVGWVGPDDPTIRPAALPLVRRVGEPYATNLATAAARAWADLLPGVIWVMPKSHWAYELQFGSAAWLPGELRAVGIDPGELIGRTNAAAIETDSGPVLMKLIEALLTRLDGSDFALGFPGRPAVATVHHHGQVWWTSSDPAVTAGLDRIVGPA